MVARWLTAFLFAFAGIACGAPPSGAVAAESRAPLPEATVELDSLLPGVWIHTSYYTYPNGSRFSSNGLVVGGIGGEGLTLIDTAWGERLTVSLLEQIERRITRHVPGPPSAGVSARTPGPTREPIPVRLAIVTHAHGDRLAGADVLRERGIPVLSHPETIRRALAVGLPPPSDSLGSMAEPGGIALVGGVEVYYPGPGHSPDNVMVWVNMDRGVSVSHGRARPEPGLLFGGCAVRPTDATTLGNTAHADVKAWHASVQRALERYGNAGIVVPGHGATGGPELLRHTLSLLRR